jgi:predicted hydrocarbon binding protein
MSIQFKADQVFDPKKARQYINDEASVFHCHHYATLFSQLADDAKLLRGATLLAESAEESFYPVLVKYFKENSINVMEDRIAITEQYCSFIGLGKVKIIIDKDKGSAEMPFSHVDEGWIKKWSKRDKPVNFIGQGFLAAAFSAILDCEPNVFNVEEVQSIVAGASFSRFEISKK